MKVLRHILVFGATCFATCVLHAQPILSESGWTVERIFSVDDPSKLQYIASDVTSGALFVHELTRIGGAIGSRIHRLEADGTSRLIDQFDGPDVVQDMAFDPLSRTLHMTRGEEVTGNYTLRMIDEFGVFIEEPDLPEESWGLAIDPSGALHASFINLGEVGRYNPGDDTFTTLHSIPSLTIRQMEFAEDGTLFLSAGDIHRIDTDGTTTRFIGSGGGVALGDESLFTSGFGVEIRRVSLDGSSITTFATGHLGINGLSFFGDDTLYVSDRQDLWKYTLVPEPSGCLVLLMSLPLLLRFREKETGRNQSRSARWLASNCR
jgi:hypothetical protein